MLWAGKIYKDRGDRWYIRLNDGTKICCNRDHESFYSRQEAERCLALEIQPEINKPSFDPAFWSKKKKSLKSFSVFAEEWLKTCEIRMERNELSPTYIGSLRNYVNNLWIPFFGDLNMLEITGRELNRFYLSLRYSPKTIHNVMTGLAKLFRDAYRQQVIPSMPWFPQLESIPEFDAPWASEEIQEKIFEHLSPDALFMILFMATHATRPGEARALQVKDVNLSANTVTIARAFADDHLRPFTKSKRIRVLPLDEAWKALYLARPRAINPDSFVFCDSEGSPRSRNWSRNQWNAAREAAGIAHITLYQGTRHSLASQAGNRGVPVQLISKFLGHSNIKQTERYMHLQVNPLKQVQRKADVKPIFRKLSANKKKADP